MEFENLNSRNVFRARKQENQPKQLWKKKRIDALGNHEWIVNSEFERHPRTNEDLVLTAMGSNTLKLKGIPQRQSHFRYEKSTSAKGIKVHIF